MPEDRAPPRISIVTPSFNHAAFLAASLRSVLDQGYPALEYIVMDGGSTDGSVEILERHAADLAYWVSEPDGGQSDAVNRGFARATGDILGWVNDLDNLEDETRAFLLEGEEFSELIDQIEPELGWDQLIIAWDMNERGQIVGGGRRFGELGHAFLLTPLESCQPCDMNCDDVVDAFDVEPFLGLLFEGSGPCASCTGDVNGDGVIDAFDIEPFLGCLFP